MDDPAESLSSFNNDKIFRLEDPEQIDDIKGLSDRITINILQMLNSKVTGRNFNSWWSIGAIRQITFIDRTSKVEKILIPFVRLGIIDALKISELPSYSISKRGAHGLLGKTETSKHRKKYERDGFCYRLRTVSIDLIFRDDVKRSLFIPLENLHLDNLRLLHLLLRRRTMLILRAFEKDVPLQKDDFINFLNSYYARTDEKDHTINYDISSLYKLTKECFRDNLSNKIYSNPPLKRPEWIIINKERLQIENPDEQENNSISYSLNFDMIRFLFTDQMGKRFQDNDNSFQIHYPKLNNIYRTIEPKENLYDDITNNGIVVDIQ